MLGYGCNTIEHVVLGVVACADLEGVGGVSGPPPPHLWNLQSLISPIHVLLEMKKIVIFHICALPQLYVKLLKVGPPPPSWKKGREKMVNSENWDSTVEQEVCVYLYCYWWLHCYWTRYDVCSWMIYGCFAVVAQDACVVVWFRGLHCFVQLYILGGLTCCVLLYSVWRLHCWTRHVVCCCVV